MTSPSFRYNSYAVHVQLEKFRLQSQLNVQVLGARITMQIQLFYSRGCSK
jgi:hypothetical protein